MAGATNVGLDCTDGSNGGSSRTSFPARRLGGESRPAAIGPGIEVFSRYAKVVEPTGESIPVRGALTLINQVLAEQEGECDGDTRFAIKWFEQYGFDKAGYNPAEGLARATNVSVKGLEEADLVARAGRVRVLRRAELAPGSGIRPPTSVRRCGR